jgi:hypothetical protein
MGKTSDISILRSRLSSLNEQKEKLEPLRFKPEGGLNTEVYTELGLISTNIYLTKKKIDFVKRGKPFLGDCLGDNVV